MKTKRLLVLLTFLLCLCPYAQSQADKWNDLTQQTIQLVSAGRFLEALPLAQQAVQEAQTVFSNQSVNYGLSVGGVGYIQMVLGRNAEAEKNLLNAETVISAAVGSDAAPIQQTLANLAQLYYNEATQAATKSPQQLALLSKSENYAKRNSDLFYKLKPADDPAQVGPLEALSSVYAAENKFPLAKSTAEKSYAIERANLPPGHVQIIRTRSEIAWCRLQMGDRTGAIADYKQLLTLAETSLGTDNPVTISVRQGLQLAQGGTL